MASPRSRRETCSLPSRPDVRGCLRSYVASARGHLCALTLSASGLARCGVFNPLPDPVRNLADNSLVHVISGHQKPNAPVREQLIECWLAIPAHIGLAESAKRHHWDNAPRMGGDPAALPCSSSLTRRGTGRSCQSEAHSYF